MSGRLEPVLDELVRSEPRLLRAERAPLAGRTELSRALVLTFDQARLIAAPAEDGKEIAIRLEAGEETGRAANQAALEDSAEEEPWWRVLGNPLHGAWARSDAAQGQASLRLQFRRDDANPRVITIELHGGGLRIHLLPFAVPGAPEAG